MFFCDFHNHLEHKEFEYLSKNCCMSQGILVINGRLIKEGSLNECTISKNLLAYLKYSPL